jgi:hypothetical protein
MSASEHPAMVERWVETFNHDIETPTRTSAGKLRSCQSHIEEELARDATESSNTWDRTG